MPSKLAMHSAIISLLPILILHSGYFLLTGKYLLAFFALLFIVACMETRVRMGFRNPRGWLFATHLTCGILVLGVILMLAHHSSAALLSLAESAYIGMLATGIVLVKNSWPHRTSP